MIYSVFLALSLLSQINRPQFDPRLNWQTLKTEHFWIHHPAALKEQAHDLADRAESMWPEQTTRFNWIPSNPIQMVISDQTDSPNGLATPLPYNTIFLYPVPPADDSTLDYYDDWMNTLFVHEFTHSIHLDMAKGLNRIPRFILGRFWLPNAAQQQWSHEGLAIHYETNETTRGRGRSSFMEMFFRTASLEGNFAGIDRATYYNDEYPYGNAAYYYGIGFHQYIERQYGKDKMTNFAHITASNPVPSALNFKTKKIFGKSFHRLWEEWKADEYQKWTAFKNSVSSNFSSQSPDGQEWQILGVPTWDPEGDRFFASVRNDDETQIREFKKSPSSDRYESSLVIEGTSSARLSYFNKHLLYTIPGRRDRYTSTNDLYVYDLEKKKSTRITRGLRVRDPFYSNGSVYLVRTDGYKSELVRLPWADVVKAKQLDKPLRNLNALEVIFRADGYDALSKPAVDPTASSLVFSMKKTNRNRDLYLIDLQTKKLTQLTDDFANDQHPQFSEDGKTVFYASDHKFPSSDQRVPNLVALDLKTNQKRLITDALTGVSYPAIKNNIIAAGVYTAYGFRLAMASLNLSKAQEIAESTQPQAEVKKFEKAKILSEDSYTIGSTLWPRFLAPIFLYTETDILLGAQTLSYDPLGRHLIGAAAFHRFEPNRPAGTVSYMYGGLTWVKPFVTASTFLTDYGQVLFTNTGLSTQKYFERAINLTVGLSIPIDTDESGSNWNLGLSFFGEDRRSEFGLPAGLLTGLVETEDVGPVRLDPESGQTLGARLGLSWADGFEQPIQFFSPTAGRSFSLSIEYTPEFWKTDFHTLTTIASGKYFVSPWLDHVIGLRFAAGYQWLDVLYLHAFLMGGAIGEGPLTSTVRQSYSLRGLPQSAFRGEGIMVGSFEYRLPLLKKIPGFGTSPFWLKNLHAALVSDAGQVFTQWQDQIMIYEADPDFLAIRKFSPSRFTVSAGAEIRSDVSMFYLPPITFRLGYARVLYLRGNWIANRDNPIDEMYLQAGASF